MNYHDITKDDMKNGDGLRVVLWVAGCPHRCPGCHNPITWDADGGIPFDQAAEQEIYEQLEKPYISGITFSGGDPLYEGNRNAIHDLAAYIKEKYPEKDIWLYTGYRWKQVMGLPLMRHIDVCVDGRFDMDKADENLMWKGSTNQRVIDVQATLSAKDPTEPVLYCGDYSKDMTYAAGYACCGR